MKQISSRHEALCLHSFLILSGQPERLVHRSFITVLIRTRSLSHQVVTELAQVFDELSSSLCMYHVNLMCTLDRQGRSAGPTDIGAAKKATRLSFGSPCSCSMFVLRMVLLG